MRAHQEWKAVLNRKAYQAKLSQGRFLEIGSEAIRIESRTNLLFSFEKMAIRDALKPERGARAFAEGLLCSSARPRKRSSKIQSLVRSCRGPATQAKPRTYLAPGYRVRIHRST